MELPRPAIVLARAYLVIAGALVLAGLIGGLAMHLELWAPGGRSTAAGYTTMLSLHGLALIAVSAPLLAGAVGYALVCDLAAVERLRVPLLGWMGVAAACAGVALAIHAIVVPSSGWSLYVPGEPESRWSETGSKLALAIAGALVAVHLAIAILEHLAARRRATDVVLAAAFVLAVLAASACSAADALIDGAHAKASMLALRFTVVAALVLATAVVARREREALVLVGLGGAIAWAFGARLGLAAVAVPWVAGLIRSPRAIASWVVVGGVLSAMATATAIARVLAASELDIHLADTYAIVGEHHAVGFVLAFALLAGLHAWSRRRPHPVVAPIGLAIAAIGAVRYHAAMVELGGRGMPRRYWDYDPLFATDQRVAAIAAGIVALGFVVIALAWLLGRRAGD